MKRIFTISIVLLIALTIMAQWSSESLVNTQLTDFPGEQVLPKTGITPDDSYFAGYFSSEDGNYNIRLQLLDNEGNRQWEEDDLLISTHPSLSWITDWDMAVDIMKAMPYLRSRMFV